MPYLRLIQIGGALLPYLNYVEEKVAADYSLALKNTGYALRDGVELRESRKVSFAAEGLTASDPSVAEPRDESSPCSPVSQWGAVLTARDVTPTGMTLVLSRVEGSSTRELHTGTWYRLERQENGLWTALEPLPQEGNVVWTDIAWLFPEPGQECYEHAVDWERLYGALSAGQYRMVKEITDFRAAGDYDTAEFYVEFVIE